jgi:hypothetical protein
LRANTELVEKVKSDVNREDWAAREWKNLRRLKLEELLTKMHEADNFLEFLRIESIYGRVVHDRSDPIGAFETIGKLYFPELTQQTFELVRLHHENRIASVTLAKDLLLEKKKPTLEQCRDEIIAKFHEADGARSAQIATARQALKTAARNLLVGIVGFK